MEETIFYEPNEIWKRIQQNPAKDEIFVVAENAVTQIGVIKEDGYVGFIVTTDYKEPFETEIEGEEDCESTAESLIQTYIHDEMTERLYDIEDRESDLNVLFEDLLCNITKKIFFAEGGGKAQDEMVSKIKEKFLEDIYKEYGLNPYRPMFLVNEETGEEIYTEYPYEYLIEKPQTDGKR